jgi:hypothetical protein
MAFSESDKMIVKRKAAFRCCRCQQIGVEIHHIIPEKEGGENHIDNAAPLCAKCHADFGDNPMKRKELRGMRDWWYEKAVNMFKLSPYDEEAIGKLSALVEAVQDNKNEIYGLKTFLKEFVNRKIDDITPDSSAAYATTIINTMTLNAPLPAIHMYGYSGKGSGSGNIVSSESGSVPFDDKGEKA